MDELEKLGYTKYDNHPEPCGPEEWTTQDCHYIEYTQKDCKGNQERIHFDVEGKNVWISAIKNENDKHYRIPAPLNFEEIEAIYKILKKLL